MTRSAAAETATGRILIRTLPLVLCAYLVFIRTIDISRTFWLFGDQTLYWRIALGPWRELPIGGGPSQLGGTTIGPIFCWTLWALRHLIGPWTDNLPHAGGIGLSLVQSAADAFLFAAIWNRFTSLPLAAAVVIFAASAPYDMALTATIWNPPLAVAFAKTAIACVLFGGRARSTGWTVGATGAAVLAVQAHSSGLFFAAPVVASFTLRELLDRQWTRAARIALLTTATVLVLELPYLADRLMQPDKVTRPVAVADSVTYTLAHPASLHPVASFQALSEAMAFILLRPWSFSWMSLLLVAGAAICLYRVRDDVTLAGVTVLPLAAAVVGFSFWQGQYDHYWYLVMVPSASLTLALAATAWRPAATAVSATLAILALLVQPARVADAQTIHRLPEYEPLVRGAHGIRRYTPEVRTIATAFELPRGVDPTFLYGVLGGQLNADARFDATIDRSGHVTFTPAPAFRTR